MLFDDVRMYLQNDLQLYQPYINKELQFLLSTQIYINPYNAIQEFQGFLEDYQSDLAYASSYPHFLFVTKLLLNLHILIVVEARASYKNYVPKLELMNEKG